jgi:hypothetical protein
LELSTHDAEKVLRKAGVDLRQSTHHVRGFIMLDGKAVLPVHFSHGRKDLPGPVPNRFRKSLRMTVEEFRLFRSCELSKEQYLVLLRTRLQSSEGGWES